MSEDKPKKRKKDYKKGTVGRRQSTRSLRVVPDFRPDDIYRTYIFSNGPRIEAILDYDELASIEGIHELSHLIGLDEGDAQFLAMDVDGIVRAHAPADVVTDVKIVSTGPGKHVVGFIALYGTDESRAALEARLAGYETPHTTHVHSVILTYALIQKEGQTRLHPVFLGKPENTKPAEISVVLADRNELQVFPAVDAVHTHGKYVLEQLAASCVRGTPQLMYTPFAVQGKNVLLVTAQYSSKAQQQQTEDIFHQHMVNNH